jgi:glc operon protein GlcG
MCSQLLCLAPRYSPAAKEMPSSPQRLQRARDVVPDKMPFYTPMDLLFRRNAPKQAAMDEAIKHDWPMNIAIIDSGANLVAFLRMDGALLASIAVAEQKARTAAKFRRPTKALEDAIQKLDYKFVLSVDDVIAARGGIPLLEDGKIIGAIGCSGGAGSQDEAVCMAGAATISK